MKKFLNILAATALLAFTLVSLAFASKGMEQAFNRTKGYSYPENTEVTRASISHTIPSIVSPSGRRYYDDDVVDLNDFLGTPGDETDWNCTELDDAQWSYLQTINVVIDTAKNAWVIKVRGED